jgi:hypothetical protein
VFCGLSDIWNAVHRRLDPNFTSRVRAIFGVSRDPLFSVNLARLRKRGKQGKGAQEGEQSEYMHSFKVYNSKATSLNFHLKVYYSKESTVLPRIFLFQPVLRRQGFHPNDNEAACSKHHQCSRGLTISFGYTLVFMKINSLYLSTAGVSMISENIFGEGFLIAYRP